MKSPDIIIIGSGIGGATIASALADTDSSVLILERGEQLPDTPHARSSKSIFMDSHYRPKEEWLDGQGTPFNPGNYYYIGGNSKFFGAVFFRYRKEDFDVLEHFDGVSPAWPFSYEELEPWYCKAEQLFNVRGPAEGDATEPFHSKPYPFAPVPDEPDMARHREKLTAAGLNPRSLPLGVDIERWLKGGQTPWDAFPDTRSGKMDAESCPLAKALAAPNVSMQTGAYVETLETSPDGKKIIAVNAVVKGVHQRLTPKIVILSAGAVNSSALLLRSANTVFPNGLANSSDQVGRNFMNHNLMAFLAMHPFEMNRSVYQKTFGINDFYFSDGKGSKPLGNMQLVGKIDGNILKANVKTVPGPILGMMARRSFDYVLTTEDLPNPDSRVRLNGANIVLDWQRSNMRAMEGLEKAMRERFRAAGYPIIMTRLFDKRTPSHQCGTILMGDDPAKSALDPYCKAWDHDNLYVVDASFMPTSAAVNPALTIAAQALRVGDMIRQSVLEI